jgi:hypothetical protein
MRSLPEYHSLRICLKYIHLVSSGLWLGSGCSILFLLFLNSQNHNEKELFAYNIATTNIDNYLLIPSACICILSGAIICVAEDLMMFSCSWIITKCVCSIMALALGTFIAPGIDQLSGIVNFDRVNIRYNHEYIDILTANIILAISQTLILLYVIFISIKRPCSNYKNCKYCRESLQAERNGSQGKTANTDRTKSFLNSSKKALGVKTTQAGTRYEWQHRPVWGIWPPS